MGVVFEADATAVAVYNDAGDPADRTPFTDPTQDAATFARVKFHSGLDYPKIIKETSYTLNLPAITGGSQVTRDYIVEPHGRLGQPWVLGYAIIGGQRTGFAGSLCVGLCSNGSKQSGLGRWISLGADANNIIIHEYAVRVTDPLNYRFSAVSIPVTILTTDRLL